MPGTLCLATQLSYRPHLQYRYSVQQKVSIPTLVIDQSKHQLCNHFQFIQCNYVTSLSCKYSMVWGDFHACLLGNRNSPFDVTGQDSEYSSIFQMHQCVHPASDLPKIVMPSANLFPELPTRKMCFVK